jgi:hypothetical protein
MPLKVGNFHKNTKNLLPWELAYPKLAMAESNTMSAVLLA